MKPTISVIIPTYNSSSTIQECLRSIIAQKTPSVEIIVVDCSVDTTPELVKQFKDVQLIQLPKRVFPGEARNIGIKKSKGRIVALIDSDCIADSNWLQQIAEHMKTYRVIGGSVDNASTNLTSWADHFLSFGEFLSHVPAQYKNFVPTCNVAYKRDIFDRVGYFPPAQRASEDVFFNTKVAQEAGGIWFTPLVRIRHRSRTNAKQYLRHQHLLGKNAADVRLKRKDIYGSFLVNSVYLSALLPFIRFVRVSRRIAKYSASTAFLFILTIPLIMVGLLSWGYGFLETVARNRYENKSSHEIGKTSRN